MSLAVAGSLIDLSLAPVIETASGRDWTIRPADPAIVEEIAASQRLDLSIARALAARGISPAGVFDFLNPKLRRDLPDPNTLLDMECGAARLAEAVIDGECIGVFGDYDVDGTTASAILHKYFSALGVRTEIYLPDRIAEGYGPTAAAFETLRERGADIIVTVDCGASAHGPINEAASKGAEIIVLDHHLMDGPPPEGALATINPNRPDDQSGLGNLSAAGVAFMMTVALNRALREKKYFETRVEPKLIDLLDLVALGLVCDVMDLTGLNRTLVSQGLKVLESETNVGLAALGKRSGVKKPCSAYDLGFLIGPRINAAGRIGHAQMAFDLLTTNDREKARQLAERLHEINAERQRIEQDVQHEALAIIEADKLDANSVIVVDGEGWHLGVVGIVAGRLKEKFDKPCIVLSRDSDVAKGSARSISGVNLGAAIGEARAKNILIAGGGHAMAAGMTISNDGIIHFRTWINERLKESVDYARTHRTLHVDGVVSPTSIHGAFASSIGAIGPFGPGNAEPVYVIEDVAIVDQRIVGENHLSLKLRGADGDAPVNAIAFRAVGEPLGELLQNAQRVTLAGKIRTDAWRGGDAAQLQIVDAAIPA